VLEQIDTIAALRARLTAREPFSPKGDSHRCGLVPTMGALHAGHAELIRRARSQCDIVVVSIFVNPLQFDNPDDLTRYPRELDTDVEMCRELGVDVVFAPGQAEMYPGKPEVTIDVGRLGDYLCGKFRPGHFRGMATVVLKLLQIVQPDVAYFGEKDAQQLAIIRRMVADLNVHVAIAEVPTVREADGLALSSRNRHLTPGQRASAALIYQGLMEARRCLALGERDAATISRAGEAVVGRASDLKLEYFEIVDAGTMQPVARVAGPVRIACAVWAGPTRLIDNVAWHAPLFRTASLSDASALAALINSAFEVESFFKVGDRTNAAEVADLMQSGEFVLMEEGGELCGCVYLTRHGDRAYFGMLSIRQEKRGQGLGRRLIDAVEDRARGAGCRFMDIHIVNLREELPGLYRRFGYVEQGTLPFSEPTKASRACHFIVMTKAL
jgi:pantoate--beta-alanine ligase